MQVSGMGLGRAVVDPTILEVQPSLLDLYDLLPATILTRPPLELLLSLLDLLAMLVELLAVCESRQEQAGTANSSLLCSHVSQEEGTAAKS
jgi:hypothetical protein